MKKKDIQKMQDQADKRFGYTLKEVNDYRESWRIFRIMAEFVEGYQFLSTLKNEVTILGSARLKGGSKYYEIAKSLGSLLGKNGYTTITGGGPGIMEAANRGAFEVGGKSVGLNIELPFEQVLNTFVTKTTSFYYFFTRKVMLTSPAHAFVYFPGGFGTLDELFEVVDHMEQGFMRRSPIILVGHEFWEPVLDFLKTRCVAKSSVKEEWIDAWHVVDSAEEAYELIAQVDMEASKEYDPSICNMSSESFHDTGNINWKIFRIMAEMVEGFEFVSGLEKSVTVLGTKNIPEGSKYISSAEKLGKLIAESGKAVITGGKYGIAESVNKGAYESDGKSFGISMEVDGDVELNNYLTKSIIFKFPFTRKMVVTAPTDAFVFYPGGFGTLHQLFEVLTMIQTKKMKPRPIILLDHDFWQPMHSFIKKMLVHDIATISDEDDELYQIVDSEQGVMEVLKKWKK
jgi:uncharacterized protein (TIGR00730 family)